MSKAKKPPPLFDLTGGGGLFVIGVDGEGVFTGGGDADGFVGALSVDAVACGLAGDFFVSFIVALYRYG